jgi:hypothetical protein
LLPITLPKVVSALPNFASPTVAEKSRNPVATEKKNREEDVWSRKQQCEA